MKFAVVVKSLSLLFSLCCVAMLPALPSNTLLLFSVPLLAALLFLKPRLGLVYWPMAIFVGGFVYGCITARDYISQRLPADLLGVEVEITATIVSLPHRDERRLRFLSELESIRPLKQSKSITWDGRIRLSWYGSAAPDLMAGDKVRLVVKLKSPSGFMNPGGFDLEQWMAQKKIIATGYVRSKSFDVSKSVISRAWAPVSSMRNLVQQKLLNASDGLDSLGVILALAVGDRSGISKIQWDSFIATGTNHLLAISGLHISLVAGVFALAVRGLWRYTSLSRRSTRSGCALVVGLLAAFCYSAMAGFSVPTLRALMMFVVLVFLIMARRHQRRTQSLAVALTIVSLLDPLSVMSPGFWMSFAAVAVLYIVFSNAQGKGFYACAQRLMRGHVLISIGLYPLTLLFFGQASLIAPFANLLVTPLVGMLVTPLVFLSALLVFLSESMAATVLVVADFLLQFAFSLLAYLSGLPFALVKLAGLSSSVLVLASCSAVLMLVPLSNSLRLLSWFMLLPLVFASAKRNLDAGAYEVIFLDVGQGTSVVVLTARHTLVYDTGDQFSTRFNAADAVIVPYLHSRSISSIDRLVVSHADRDHAGGADDLLQSLQVSSLMMSDRLPQLPDEPYVRCSAGDSWVWDEVSFVILHPQLEAAGSKNDRSCVLSITSAGGTTLLPGDIEASGEYQLLQSGLLQPADIMLSPHHGSATSSGSGFINAVQPEYVIHSTGYKNRFGFPKQEVTRRYSAIGAAQFNTAETGAIEFLVSDAGIEVSQYREQSRRWWHRR